MPGPSLLAVLLNYRTADMTLDAAEAALAALEGIEGGLVIVDNASGDGSFERLSAEAEARGWTAGERVRVIASPRNGGFGAGNNVGIRAGLPGGARPDYVYILNSDAFPARDAIRRLLDHLEANPGVGFAGSYIHGPEGDPHTTLFRFPSIAGEFEGQARLGPVSRLLSHAIVPLPIPEAGAIEVDWLAGASMMMRTRVLEEIGLFDERFFLYYEETDLCRRAKAAGWPTVYVRESEVAHIGSVSTGMKRWERMPRYWLDSRQHYFAKNHGVGYALAATLARLSGGLVWETRRLLSRKGRADPRRFLPDLAGHAVGYWTRRALGRPPVPEGATDGAPEPIGRPAPRRETGVTAPRTVAALRGGAP